MAAAIFALPVLAASYAGAGERPYFGRQCAPAAQCDRTGPGRATCDVCRARADVRAAARELHRDRARGACASELRADRTRLRAEMRGLRHERREMRRDGAGPLCRH